MSRRLVALVMLIGLIAPIFGTAQETDSLSRRLDRLGRWMRSPRESIRLEAIVELQDIPNPNACTLLLSAVTDTSSVVRASVVSALSRTKDKRVVPAIRPLLKDSNEEVRASAAWTLCQSRDKTLLPDILALCRTDPSGLVRFRAVWGLAKIGDRSALPTVIDALGDYNPAVRERSALLALAALEDETVGERLIKQARNDFPPTRRIVMYLFSRYGERRLIETALQQGLRDTDPLVRAEAALSLGKRLSKNSGSFLLSLLKDPDEHVRGSSAYALKLIGDKSAVEPLKALLNDDSAFVRAVAAEALRHLGEKSVQPPDGFKAADLFTYPIYSPEHSQLYR